MPAAGPASQRYVKLPLAKARGFGACRTALRDSRRCQVGNRYSIPGLASAFGTVTWERAKPALSPGEPHATVSPDDSGLNFLAFGPCSSSYHGTPA
jgi:hypothetical protein